MSKKSEATAYFLIQLVTHHLKGEVRSGRLTDQGADHLIDTAENLAASEYPDLTAEIRLIAQGARNRVSGGD